MLAERGCEITQYTPGMTVDRTSFDLVLYLFGDETIMARSHIFADWRALQGGPIGAMERYWNDVPTLMISFGYPYMLYDAPRVPTYINAYMTGETMQRAPIREDMAARHDRLVAEQVKHEIEARAVDRHSRCVLGDLEAALRQHAGQGERDRLRHPRTDDPGRLHQHAPVPLDAQRQQALRILDQRRHALHRRLGERAVLGLRQGLGVVPSGLVEANRRLQRKQPRHRVVEPLGSGPPIRHRIADVAIVGLVVAGEQDHVAAVGDYLGQRLAAWSPRAQARHAGRIRHDQPLEAEVLAQQLFVAQPAQRPRPVHLDTGIRVLRPDPGRQRDMARHHAHRSGGDGGTIERPGRRLPLL